MTFRDVFKSSFLDNVSSISILDMALAARRIDDDYNTGYSGSDIQCSAVARYGGCTVYSEIPHGD